MGVDVRTYDAEQFVNGRVEAQDFVDDGVEVGQVGN